LKPLPLDEDGVDRKLMTMGIEEALLFRLFGVSIGSISIFILGAITSGFLQLTLGLLVEASAEGVCLKFSLGVNSSTRTLVLTWETLGWYFLVVDAVVNLRYPFGFNNLSGIRYRCGLLIVWVLSSILSTECLVYLWWSHQVKDKNSLNIVFNLCSLSKIESYLVVFPGKNNFVSPSPTMVPKICWS
jgi:hypothetical protein